MKYINLICFASAILFLNACQTETTENENHLFITYEVRYLEQENELRAYAYFKEGDTLETAQPIEISNPTFQGNAMEKQDLGAKGIRYIFTKKGPYSDNLEFSYKKDKNYKINMSEVGMLSVKEGVVNKNIGATIVWDGDLVTSSQSFILMFTNEDNSAASISIQGPSEISEVAISPGSLTQLVPGDGQFYIVKKQVQKSEDQNQTITAVVEYYADPIKIQVVE